MKLVTIDWNGIEIEVEYDLENANIYKEWNIEILGMFVNGLDWRGEEFLTSLAIEQIEKLAISKIIGD